MHIQQLLVAALIVKMLKYLPFRIMLIESICQLCHMTISNNMRGPPCDSLLATTLLRYNSFNGRYCCNIHIHSVHTMWAEWMVGCGTTNVVMTHVNFRFDVRDQQ